MGNWFRQITHWIGKRPSRTFFLCFLLLNSLLFLPLYLLNWEETTFFPFAPPANNDWSAFFHQLTVGRDNFDPFRVNIELLLFICLLVNFGWLRRRGTRALFIGLYFFFLGYYIYEAITLSIYQSEPVFYNHYFLALDGLGYLFGHLNIAIGIYAGAALLAMAAIWVIYRLVALFYQSTLNIEWGLLGKLCFAGVGLLVLFAVVEEQHALAAPTTVLSSFSYKMEENIEKSLELYHRVADFDDTALQQAYDYSAYTLPRKPNLYLIFVESYGSVLYKRPDYRIDYAVLLKQLKRALDQQGWYSTSALSVSPTWGGGSWLSYTSVQFGLHIDNHPYYLTLMDKYQHARYPHLGSYLQDQGYKSYRISSLSVDLEQDSWERYERMYNVDGWFRFEDLHYSGPLYGWGPAAPDQYVINDVHEQIVEQIGPDAPFMLFFITQSSHYPFAPIPKLVPDWHTLNGSTDEQAAIDDETRSHDVRRQDYFNAIAYELNVLVQFILQNDDKDALYILIGDHQPPRVSRRADGFDTPVHIISRDAALLAAFQDYGFTPGLWVNEQEPTLKHEGIYSMVVRTLLREEENTTDLPPYLPDGFVMPDTTVTHEQE